MLNRPCARVQAEDLARRIAARRVQEQERGDDDADQNEQRPRDPAERVAARERQLSQTSSRRYAPPGLTAKPLTRVLVA